MRFARIGSRSCPRPPPEIVGHAGRYRVAGDLLAVRRREQDERQIGVVLANGLQKREAIHPREVVVADDAVDPIRCESVQSLTGTGDDIDGERLVRLLEPRRHVHRGVPPVVDEQDPHRLAHTTCSAGNRKMVVLGSPAFRP